MERHWPLDKNYSSLEIRKFKNISQHDVIAMVSIKDQNVIQGFVDRIKKIPPDGDMMISFSSEAEHIRLLFGSGDQLEPIDIFQKGFKTPSTGFNSRGNETELALYRDIDALLYPDFDKPILIIRGLTINFKDFSIEYLGSEFRDGAPTSLSFNINKYLVKDKNKKEQMLELVSGQLPPQPLTIEVNNSRITLLTYKTKDSFRLYPAYFQMGKL